MRVRLLIIFLLILVIPIIGVSWLGIKGMRDKHEIFRHRIESLIEQKLLQIDAKIVKLIKKYERNLYSLYYHTDYTIYGLRRIINRNQYINQILVADRRGRPIFPSPFYLTKEERQFLNRSQGFLKSFKHSNDKNNVTTSGSISIVTNENSIYVQQKTYLEKNIPEKTLNFSVNGLDSSHLNTNTKQQRGWTARFWGNGMNLLYWYINRSGYLIAIEVSREKLLSDIIAILPSPQFDSRKKEKSLITLTTNKGTVLHQWGHYQPGKHEKSFSKITLSSPLYHWSLNYYTKTPIVNASINYLPILFGMSTVILAMIGLAFYFYRENNRELTVAQQRVTFVNQVSHELKTPLTNIRMYAELLENDLDNDDISEQAQNRVDVIVNESQRLSRLINNVLNFARKQKGKLNIVKSLNNIDQVIDSVIEQCRPALTRDAIKIEFIRGAGQNVYLDPDILEQIIHNLISNVEKYATNGKYLGIKSQLNGTTEATITIADKGPGIPRSVSEKIFEAFYRIDSKLTQGVSGTGIGLAIARDLARLHGGDLILAKSNIGSTFILTLNIEKA